MKLKSVLKETAALSLLISLGVWGAATLAAPGDTQSDVVVKKNADGTVDAFDKPSTPAPAPAAHAGGKHFVHGKRGQSGEAPQVNVIYRLHNPVGTRHINGVSVHTNPDGSIETSDGESAPVPLHRAAPAAKKKHK